jgi:hypothetical protein
METSYLALAFLDKYWSPNRQEDDGRLSIRYFLIAWGLWSLTPGLDLLCRQ